MEIRPIRAKRLSKRQIVEARTFIEGQWAEYRDSAQPLQSLREKAFFRGVITALQAVEKSNDRFHPVVTPAWVETAMGITRKKQQ